MAEWRTEEDQKRITSVAGTSFNEERWNEHRNQFNDEQDL